ncbi:MAG: hypothetical protein AAFR31_11490, partial [Cyanobacteria bacterium J06627_8]
MRLTDDRPLTVAASLVFTLVIAGCGDRPPSTSQDTTASGTVTILGSITGEGADTIEEIFEPFTAETGIDVVYEGTDAFATLLPVRIDG